MKVSMLKIKSSEPIQFNSARFSPFTSPIQAELSVSILSVGILVVLALGGLSVFTAIAGGNPMAALYIFFCLSIVIACGIACGIATGGRIALIPPAVMRLFNWRPTQVRVMGSADHQDRPKVYQVTGQLFYGSVSQFSNHFHYLSDPQQVVLDFSHAQIYDYAATQAIEQVMTQYQCLNKGVNLVGLNYQSHAIVRKSGIGTQVVSSQNLPFNDYPRKPVLAQRK